MKSNSFLPNASVWRHLPAGQNEGSPEQQLCLVTIVQPHEQLRVISELAWPICMESIDWRCSTAPSAPLLTKIYWEYITRSFDWSLVFGDIKYFVVLVKSQNCNAKNLEITSRLTTPMLLWFRPCVLQHFLHYNTVL